MGKYGSMESVTAKSEQFYFYFSYFNLNLIWFSVFCIYHYGIELFSAFIIMAFIIMDYYYSDEEEEEETYCHYRLRHRSLQVTMYVVDYTAI